MASSGRNAGRCNERLATRPDEASERLVHRFDVPRAHQRLGHMRAAHHARSRQLEHLVEIHRCTQGAQDLDHGLGAPQPLLAEPRQRVRQPPVLRVHVVPEDVQIGAVQRGRDLDSGTNSRAVPAASRARSTPSTES